MSEPLSPNTTIAQYTIVSKIGEGGMKIVYRARDPKLGRDVAIKLLPTSVSENVERLNRFEQEAKAAGALNHPNILIYHIGEFNGAPFIVAELLEGEELRQRLDQGPIPLRGHTDRVRKRIETKILRFFPRTLVSQNSAAKTMIWSGDRSSNS